MARSQSLDTDVTVMHSVPTLLAATVVHAMLDSMEMVLTVMVRGNIGNTHWKNSMSINWFRFGNVCIVSSREGHKVLGNYTFGISE